MRHQDRQGNEPTQRQLRVGEEIRHILANILEREMTHNQILINTYITVTEVRVSPDLKHAKVFVMPMGGKNMKEVVHALNDVAPLLQSKIGRQLTTKFTPRLFFEADLTYDEAEKINRLIQAEKKRPSNEKS